MEHSDDLNGYALSTFANACHEMCNRMSQLSNARSLVSKYVLDRSESKILWLYGFSIFFVWKYKKFKKNKFAIFEQNFDQYWDFVQMLAVLSMILC